MSLHAPDGNGGIFAESSAKGIRTLSRAELASASSSLGGDEALDSGINKERLEYLDEIHGNSLRYQFDGYC